MYIIGHTFFIVLTCGLFSVHFIPLKQFFTGLDPTVLRQALMQKVRKVFVCVSVCVVF